MIRVEVVADWQENPPPETFVATDGGRWHISLPETAAAERFVSELASVPNARLLALSGTTLAVLVLLVPVSLFAVLGNGLYDLILEEQPSSRLYLLVAAALLAYIVLAAIATGSRRMSLLSQELGEMVDGFRDMTRRFHLRPARIMRQARAWARLNRLEQSSGIELWNPGPPAASGEAQIFWDILLPLCEEKLGRNSLLRLHVRSDEITAIRSALQARPGIQLESTPATPPITAAMVPGSVLSAGEMRLLQILRIACFPLQRIMACPLDLTNGPACFSENAFLRLVAHFASDQSQDAVYRFLGRCRKDYGYLSMRPEQLETLTLPPSLATSSQAETAALAEQARQLLTSDPYRFVHGDDPSSLLHAINNLAIVHDRAASDPRQQQGLKQQLRTLTSRCIESLDRGEHYALFAHIASQEFGNSPAAGQIARRLPRVIADHAADDDLTQEVLALTRFNAFAPDTLKRLARLLEVGGDYAAATAIWHKLRNIDPLLAGIRLARLYERQGQASAGLESIQPILACPNLEERPAIHVAALLEAAWLCYSTADQACLATGFTWLEDAASVLERHPGEAEAYWRWHNYRALYLDARGQYPEAITENRQALAIPGIQLKWYSGSLTNLAYVSRKYALNRHRQEPALSQALLDQSIRYATLAVDLKRRIADVDELPVALHNQALAQLCQALLQPDRAPAGIVQAKAIISEALDLLERLGSSKKRLALLLEQTLVCGLRGEDWQASFAAACQAPASPREQACLSRIEQHEDGFSALSAAVLDLEILD